MNVHRYIYGWRCWLEGLRKARRKKHGAGKQRWPHALKTAACYRFLVDGQNCQPPRAPRYLRHIRKRALGAKTEGQVAYD